MKLYVEKGVSKKGTEFFTLKVDLGYRELPISFDPNVCAEICGKSVADMYKIDKPIVVMENK